MKFCISNLVNFYCQLDFFYGWAKLIINKYAAFIYSANHKQIHNSRVAAKQCGADGLIRIKILSIHGRSEKGLKIGRRNFMILITEILGSASDPEFTDLLHAISHEGILEHLEITQRDAQRRRFRGKTDHGTDCAITLSRDT